MCIMKEQCNINSNSQPYFIVFHITITVFVHSWKYKASSITSMNHNICYNLFIKKKTQPKLVIKELWQYFLICGTCVFLWEVFLWKMKVFAKLTITLRIIYWIRRYTILWDLNRTFPANWYERRIFECDFFGVKVLDDFDNCMNLLLKDNILGFEHVNPSFQH